MKKALLLVSFSLVTAVSDAAFKRDFDFLDTIDEISEYLKKRYSNAEIVAEDDKNNVLRVSAPKGFIKIPVQMSQDLSMSFDWRSNAVQGGSGEIVRLCDYHHGKQFLKLAVNGGVIKGTSFVGKKMKSRKMIKIKPQIWYKIDLKSLGGRWTVAITERSSETVVYDSVEAKKLLRTNKKVDPKVVMFSQWKSGESFDYDNIVIE